MLPSLRPKQEQQQQQQQGGAGTAWSGVDQPRRRPSVTAKRKAVVAVACQPCQRRKHKCDGGRPACTPCLARNRSDCTYDADGDQRRTSALKNRISALNTQTEDFRDVIRGIGAAPDTLQACATARQLAADDFRDLSQVARTFRAEQDRPPPAALTEQLPFSVSRNFATGDARLTVGDPWQQQQEYHHQQFDPRLTSTEPGHGCSHLSGVHLPSWSTSVQECEKQNHQAPEFFGGSTAVAYPDEAAAPLPGAYWYANNTDQ